MLEREGEDEMPRASSRSNSSHLFTEAAALSYGIKKRRSSWLADAERKGRPYLLLTQSKCL